MIPELPSSQAGRRALIGLGVLALFKLVGWILIAVSLARGIAQLAAALPASDAAQLLQLLFDSPRTAPGLIDTLVEFTMSTDFMVTLGLGFGGAVLRGLAEWGQQVLATRAALGEKEHLRHQLVRHRLAAAGAHTDRAGEDTILASQGLDGLDDYYTDFLPALVSALVIPLGLGIWILIHDWLSAAVLLATIPLIPLFMILIGRYTEHRVEEAATGLHKLSHHLLELARGLPVLVGLRRAGMQRQALQQVSETYQRTTMNTLKAAFMSGLALELLASLSVAIIAVVIGVRLVNGSMDLYPGIMVLTLAAEVYLPFRNIGSAFHASEDGVEALKRAKAHINQPIPDSMATVLDVDAADSTAIELAQVSISYKALEEIPQKTSTGPDYLTPQQFSAAQQAARGQSVDSDDGYLPQYAVEILDPVVTNMNLRLEPGQYTVLGGASGTGKSTLLAAMAGLLTVAEATFEGSVRGLVSKPTTYLSQHPVFASQTVGQELAMVAQGTSAEHTKQHSAVHIAELTSTALVHAGLPETHSWYIDDLSPGERRRLGFARVLMRLLTASAHEMTRQPWLVILDEPTAHLDHTSASLIRQGLRKLADGVLPNGQQLNVILLVASHDQLVHAAADQLLGNVVVADAPICDAEPVEPTATAPPWQQQPVTAHPTRRVRLRDWLHYLPVNNGKFLAGIAWATAAFLAAALLSALSGWLIVQAAYEPPILYLLAVIVGVRFFGTGRAVFRYAERVTVHDAVLSWANRIRLRVWDALGSHAVEWNRLTRSGGALSVLISDVDQLRDAVPRVIVAIPAALITWALATGIVAYMAPGSWWPAVVAGVAAFILVPIIVRFVEARTTTALADHRTRLVTATSRLFTAAGDMAANGMTHRATDDFAAMDTQNTIPLKRNALAAGLGDGLTSLIAGWAAVQTLWVAIANGISAPNTALVVMLMLAMAEPFGRFSEAMKEARTLHHQLGKLLPMLEQVDDPSKQWVSLEQTNDSGIERINLDNITVSYGSNGPEVLEGLSMQALKGDFVVVVGPSGSGKSTLLAVLQGFLEPQYGTYTLTGAQRSPHQALQHVAWCPQEAYLFDSTLRSNLALARDPSQRPTDAELHNVLQTVGLGDWVATAPQGLDTRLGPSGHFISGGQRQRVAVARAILADAHVVLLDEPTAHLGADEAAELIGDLKAALADKITIMVTHDQRFVEAGTAVQL